MLKRYAVLLMILALAGCSDSETKGDKGVPSGDPVCGNQILDPGESCDGSEFDGETCESLGLSAGELACRPNCQAFDRSACGAPETCGSDSVEGPETCDGNDLAGSTCESLGYGPGTLSCTDNCAEFDVTQCGPLATCGNGQIDDNELCDGSALGGATCDSLGAGSGTLGCADNCQAFDRTQCSAGCTPQCDSRECGPDPECGSSCGTCEEGDMCTADGSCVCQPLTCEMVGAQCGTVADGCGGELDCGGCAFPAECGADGMPNTCSCPLVADGGTVAVDVPVVDINFELTIGGQAVTTANTSAPDEGGLILVNANTDERITLPDAWDNGTIEYPLTRRLVPGIYDIYYYNEGATTFWPVNNNALLQTGVDLTSSKTVTVDVPAVDIGFELTIGGQAVTTANTSAPDEGGLILVDPTTNERITLPDAWDNGTIEYPLTRRVVPGTYDIYYYNEGATTFWPVNNNALLQTGVDLTSSKTVTVDVPAVDINFELTIGGQAVTTANTSAPDEGGLILVDPTTNERITLPDAWDNGTIEYPLTRRVVTGTYDIYYYNEGATTFWPVNNNALLQTGVDLTSSKTVTVDVPAVDINFELTIGGQAVTTANTSAPDEGGLILVDPTTNERITLPDAWDNGTIEYPLTRRVVPGIYDIYYYNEGATTFWPVNNNALLQTGVDLTSSKTVTVDVPAVDINFELTIGGQAVTTANTSAPDEGGLILVDPTTNERITLPDAWDNGTIEYPLTRRVVPGTYDIYYYNEGATTFWPVNNNALLQTGVDLTSSKTVTVDVPVVDINFELTIGGQAVTTANTSAPDEGGLILVDPTTDERITLPDAWDNGTIEYPLTRRVIPGTYEVYYYNEGAMTFWPVNNNAILSCFTVQ